MNKKALLNDSVAFLQHRRKIRDLCLLYRYVDGNYYQEIAYLV